MRLPIRLALLGILAAACPRPAHAQEAGPLSVGGNLLFAQPVGEFADNVDFGFGILGHGTLDLGTAGVLGLRLDIGFVNYGNEEVRICITLPCRVTGEITTSNDILLLGIGPEIGTGRGRVRVYTGASVGLAHFSTSSSVDGTDGLGAPFAQSTNYSDLTFAWRAGPGIEVLLHEGDEALISLDLAATYHGNGEATYLTKGDIVDLPDGSVELHPRKSQTDFWTIGLGISVAIR